MPSLEDTIVTIGKTLLEDKVRPTVAMQIVLGVEAYLEERDAQKALRLMVLNLHDADEKDRPVWARSWSKAMLTCARDHGMSLRINMEDAAREINVQKLTDVPLVQSFTRVLAGDMNRWSGLRQEFTLAVEQESMRV